MDHGRDATAWAVFASGRTCRHGEFDGTRNARARISAHVTLILTTAKGPLVTPALLVQVADRLTSTTAGPFDRASNKTVVFRALDGICAIGYSGSAFIGRIHSDQWIAEILASGRAPTGGLRRGMRFCTRSLDDWPASDHVGHRLAAALNAAHAKQAIAQIEIVIAGLRETHGARIPLPFITEVAAGPNGFRAAGRIRRRAIWPRRVSDDGGPTLASVLNSQPTAPPRYLSANRTSALGAVPEQAEFKEWVDGVPRATEGADAIAQYLVVRIRDFADHAVGIGKDCMAVQMVGTTVRIRYLPFDSKVVTVGPPGNVQFARDAVYSPWIIGPGVELAPALITGNVVSTINLSGIDVAMEVRDPHPPDGGPLFTSRTQPRRPAPF